MAEHAVGLLLSAERWIPQGNRAGRAERTGYIGKELTGKTVGMIGLGKIGGTGGGGLTFGGL